MHALVLAFLHPLCLAVFPSLGDYNVRDWDRYDNTASATLDLSSFLPDLDRCSVLHHAQGKVIVVTRKIP